MSHSLAFHSDPGILNQAQRLLFLGRKDQLLDESVVQLLPKPMDRAVWNTVISKAAVGDDGTLMNHYAADMRIMIGILPEVCSRHNAPSRAWAITKLVRQAQGKHLHIVAAIADAEHALPTGLSIAKALSTYSGKSRGSEKHSDVMILGPDGFISNTDNLYHGCLGVQLAAELVDMPPNLLTTDTFVQRAKDVVSGHSDAGIEVIRGKELHQKGLGGIWAVGKAAQCPPAMVVLDWSPPDATSHIAWVGKGIVYDTGGLSIKSKTGMVGMKTDMGGAAAVLGAFQAAIRMNTQVRITAVLCIAENAVGPNALRPDDIISMYSGKTVEVNNTDAEGRLVLADGLAWVAAARQPETMVDIATLTGAQGVATGKQHAALYCNSETLEQHAITVGRSTGDLAHALPYAPEFYRKEFNSQVADMRNSVKDRSNAQSSCAGQFLGNHISKYSGDWLHIDMASPAVSAGRGTGFGVGLLLAVSNVLNENLDH